jgi:hypothetical protein
MPPKTCSCAFGHKFFQSEAKDLDFKCDRDGSKITCPVAPGAVKTASTARPKTATKPRKPKKG